MYQSCTYSYPEQMHDHDSQRGLALYCFAILASAFVLLSGVGLHAQTRGGTPSASLRSFLENRTLSEAEARQGLLERGIDLEQLTPEQLLLRKEKIVKALDELEAEKQKKGSAEQPDTLKLEPEKPKKPVRPSGVDTLPLPASGDTALFVPVEIYGHQLFSERNLEPYRTLDGANAPETYVLGAGDRVRVTIFGISQADLLLVVNEEGYVQPVGMPKIFLQGLQLSQARRLMVQRFSYFYRFNPDQFALTVKEARTITINAFGETKNKGSFSLSALNTAFNALAAAGGVSEIGSVREIELIRGKTRKKLDVYAFMDNPAMQFDFDLQHNDILYVPVAKTVVTLEGAVKRPMRYELLAGEGLRDLIRFAGGVQYNASPEYVQVERVEGDSLVLVEYALREVLDGLVSAGLQDGDIVRVRTAARPLDQYVEVSGAVFYPNLYELGTNGALGAFLQKAGMRPEARTDMVMVERRLRDGSVRTMQVHPVQQSEFLMEPRDRIQVLDKTLFNDLDTISITGEVRQPFRRIASYEDKIMLSDALLQAGGLKPNAASAGYIFRKDWFNPNRVEYLRIDLRNPGSTALRAGDRLVVYDRRTYTDVGQLSVSGAVHSPLATSYDPTMTLPGLIEMAGGLTRSASRNRVDVFRVDYSGMDGTTFDRISLELDTANQVIAGPRDFRLQPFDQVVVRDLPLFDLTRSVQISGQVLYPGPYSLSNREVRLSSLISEAGGLTKLADRRNATLIRMEGNIGQVGINLERALAMPGSNQHDPVLLPGDVVTIFPYKNTIGIRLEGTRLGENIKAGLVAGAAQLADTVRQDSAGVVSAPILDSLVHFVFQGRRSARWYLMEFAGGFARRVDKSSVTLTYPDGRVQGTRKTLFLVRDYPSVEPGTAVSLNMKREKNPNQKKGFEADKLFAQVFQTVSTLLTLTLLIRQL
jgi:protein involved in polysaccharide export with SLBB domain